MKNTVLVLGAGASVDYGYPLWEPLRQQMLNLDIDDFLLKQVLVTGSQFDAHREAYREFRTFASSNPSDTLDQIVYRIDQPKNKHLNPTGHLLINIAGHLLAKVELEKKDGGWVTDFQEVLVDYLVTSSNPNAPDANLLSTLNVVSLNYDRVFEHFISHDFYRRVVDHPSYSLPSAGIATTFSRSNQLNVFKPHGYICSLGSQNNTSHVGMNQNLVLSNTTTRGTRHPGNDTILAYGDSRITALDTFQRMGRHMYVVDERGADDYLSSNNALANADSVICVGLSDTGICQSSLVFENVHRVYLSNKASDIPKIEKQKPGPEYISLGTGGSRMDATDFPAKFKDICL